MTKPNPETERDHRRVASYPSLLESYVARYEHDRMVFPCLLDGAIELHFQTADSVEIYASSQTAAGALIGRSLLEPVPPPWKEGNIETFHKLAREALEEEADFPPPKQLCTEWHRILWGICRFAGTGPDPLLHSHYFTAVSMLLNFAWGRENFGDHPQSLEDLVRSILRRHRRRAEGNHPTAFVEAARANDFIIDYEASVMVANLPPQEGWHRADPYWRYLESLATLEQPGRISPPPELGDGENPPLGWPLEDETTYVNQVMKTLERAVHIPVWVIYNRHPELNDALLEDISGLGRTVQLYEAGSAGQVFPLDHDHSILVAS